MLTAEFLVKMFDALLGMFGTSTDELQETAGGAIEGYVKSKWREGLMIGLVGGIVIGMKFLK